jgi:electron transport complex protein RnfG
MSGVKSAAMERPRFQIDWRQALRLGLSLFVITAVAALVLAAVNALTADTIAQREQAERHAAMVSVSPGADVFSQLYSADDTVDSITGAWVGTTFVGYCVQVSPNGFGGAISLMVGVDDGGAVTGVAILDHSETPGLGARADSPDFLDQFIGKSGAITVNTGSNAIDGLTGATITSKAVTSGVNTALTAVLNYTSGEGGIPNESND